MADFRLSDAAMKAACDAYDAAVQAEYEAAEAGATKDEPPLEDHAEIVALRAALPLILNDVTAETRAWLGAVLTLFEELTRAHEAVVMDSEEDTARQADVLRAMRRGAEAVRLRVDALAAAGDPS